MTRRTVLLALGLGLIAVAALVAVALSGIFEPRGAATGTAPSGGETQAEIQYVVEPGCTAPKGAGAFCSLDEAVDKAALQSNVALVLKAGEHKLTRTIRRGVTLRAQGAPAAPSFADTVACNLPPSVLSSAPGVTLRVGAPGDKDGLVVELPDDKQKVVLNGVRLLPAAGTAPRSAALTVKQGQVALVRSELAGGLRLSGSGTTVTAVGTRLAGSGKPVATAATVAGTAIPDSDVRTYCQVPTTEGMCGVTGEVGVSVLDGARLYAVDLDLSGELKVGVCVSGGEAHLCRGSVHDTTWPDGSSPEDGWGAYVGEDGELVLRAVDMNDNLGVGVLAQGEGTSLSVAEGTRVRNTGISPSQIGSVGLGIVAQDLAEISVQDSSLEMVEGPAILVSMDASATVTDTLLQDNQFAAVVVLGATLDLSGADIVGTTASANLGGGWGLWISNDPYGAGKVTVTQSLIDGSGEGYCGIGVVGTGSEPSSVAVSESVIRGMTGNPYGPTFFMGCGVFGLSVCEGLVLSGNTYEDNSGPHIFLEGATASVSGETITTNGKLDVLQEFCTCTSAPLDDPSLQAGQAAPLVTQICDEDAVAQPYDPTEFFLIAGAEDVADKAWSF